MSQLKHAKSELEPVYWGYVSRLLGVVGTYWVGGEGTKTN